MTTPRDSHRSVASYRRRNRSLRWLTAAAGLLALQALGQSPGAVASEDGGGQSADAEQAALFSLLEGKGLDFHHFNGMSDQFYMPEICGGGGALVDYDGDGDLDIYLVQGQMLGQGKSASEARFPPRHPLPLTDRLYRNEMQPGKPHTLAFKDVSAEAGLRAAAHGFGVATGDFDNDGHTDLYLARLGSNQLLRNRGNGSFEDITERAKADDRRWSVAVSAADFDGDGWLDIYIGNYLVWHESMAKVCRTAAGVRDYCSPDAFASVSDRLLRNRGDGSFEDVTRRLGLDRVEAKTLGVVAVDLNGDHRLDYYVTSDRTPNLMWLQQADGTFREEALLAGSAVNSRGAAEASMGVDAGDLDGDGDPDLFMTHLIRETNTYYRNDGRGLFADITAQTGLGPPSFRFTSWGMAFFDYDNDGWLEMMVANGAVRVTESLASAGDPFPFHEPNQLFRNLGQGRFQDVSEQAGAAMQLSEVSRGLAVGDLDNDGDSDVLVINNNGPARVLLNEVGQAQQWLGLRLVGSQGAADRLGAEVRLALPDGGQIVRRAASDGSYAAARDPRVLIGLGERRSKNGWSVEVRWPDGGREVFPGLAAQSYHTLQQGSGRSDS